MLGITKEDIGVSLSVEEYNAVCRKEVMKYTREWELLTRKMAYWVDMSRPYVTYHNSYIETVWYLLATIYKKAYCTRGIPYSPTHRPRAQASAPMNLTSPVATRT